MCPWCIIISPNMPPSPSISEWPQGASGRVSLLEDVPDDVGSSCAGYLHIFNSNLVERVLQVP